MKITRDNYEEYFLDFAEGKLNPAQLAELGQFLQANQDLHREFEEFENLSFAADSKIKFNKKSSLKKNFVSVDGINENNYENFLIGEIENDLNGEEKKNLEAFISKNSFIEKEIKIFSKTILKANDEIVFQHKSELKHTSIIRINWQQTAAAIAIAASILLLLYFNFRKENFSPEIQNEIVERKNNPQPTVLNPQKEKIIVPESHNEKKLVAESSKEKITRHKVRSENNQLTEKSNQSAINSQQLTIDSMPMGQTSQQFAQANPSFGGLAMSHKESASLDAAGIDPKITDTITEKNEEFNRDRQTIKQPNNASAYFDSAQYRSLSINQTTPDDSFTLKEFLALSFRKNVLKENVSKKKKEARITPVDLVFAAVKGASKIFGSKIKMNKKYRDNGELAAVSFSSPRFEVSRTLHGK